MAGLIEHRQERRRRPILAIQARPRGGQAELGVEGVQCLVDQRIVIGFDDGNGLARAVHGRGRETGAERVDAVGRADLGRDVGAGAVRRQGRIGDGVAAERQRVHDQRDGA